MKNSINFQIIFYLGALFITFQGCKILKDSYDKHEQKIEKRKAELAPSVTIIDRYVTRFSSVAISEQKRFGIPASIILAQGILESGVGRSHLAKGYNNHFGIKCWCKGKRKDCVRMADDRPNDRFRVYKTAWESFRDHSKFLQSKSYKHLRHKNYRDYAHGLKKAGYATRRTYAHDLIYIVERYNLQRFDVI